MGRVGLKLDKAKEWSSKLVEQLQQKPAIKDATSLLGEIESANLVIPEAETLRKHVQKAKLWLESARRTQSRPTRGVLSRPPIDEMRGLLEEGQQLPISMAECSMIALQVHEADSNQLAIN